MMKNIIFLKSVLKQGTIMGFLFCLYTILMWLTRLDTTYLNIGQYCDIAIILLPILMIFSTIKQQVDLYKVTIIRRITIAIFVGFISYLIQDPFLYIYHHYINPDWYNSVLILKKTELAAAHIPQNQIIMILKEMKASPTAQAGLFRPATAIPTIILSILIALISLLFIKKKKENITASRKV